MSKLLQENPAAEEVMLVLIVLVEVKTRWLDKEIRGLVMRQRAPSASTVFHYIPTRTLSLLHHTTKLLEIGPDN